MAIDPSRIASVPLFAGLGAAQLQAVAAKLVGDIPELHDRIEAALDARLPTD